jgi:hypothetical protein
MIKKKVTKNVVLSAAELEYLANELKEEILLLRGQIIKAGNKYAYNKNKKVLSFVKNEEFRMEGAQEPSTIGEENNEEEKPKEEENPKEEKPNEKPIEEIHTESLNFESSGVSIPSRNTLERRKRQSLLNIDEDAIILKYCELKAKLENLEEATRNRFLHESNKGVVAHEIINEFKEDANKKIEEISEKRIEENNNFTDEIERIKNEYNKKIMELEKKVQLLELENQNKEKMLIEKEQKIETLTSSSSTSASVSTNVSVVQEKETEINQNLNLVPIEKLRELEDEIAKLNIELQFKAREAEENDSNFRELKGEYKILQNGIERLNMVK